MLKRGNPFTPSPAVVGKKTREYASPTVRTPLRNVTGGKEGLVEEVRNPPRTPLNDDESERRRNRSEIAKNRKQTKKTLMSPAVSTPRANPPSMLTPKGATPLTPSAIIADVAIKPVAAPKLTAEQRNKMFEEWMKIAADNKINAKNSWNVSLIDYFSELTFLRDGDSINFQKASCTLDGCVKIYATRVDSVADETGKLLNGLADGNKSKGLITCLIRVESKLDLFEGTHEDGEELKKQRSNKRPSRAVDTLERSLEALNLKNFDLEFAVDPLFKKMCAEFDESGARGFLTCTLSLDEKGRLMFDSSEATSLDATQDVEMADESMINISRLLETHGRHFSDLENKTVLPSLVDYSFGSADLGKMDKKLSETVAKLTAMTVNKMDIESDDDIHEDFAAFEENIPLDDVMYDEPILMDQAAFMDQSAFMDKPPLHYGKSHPQEVTEDTQGFSADTTDSFLSYFDSKIQRNWAGPEHWKIQRPSLRRTEVKPRVAKKEFILDFDSTPIDISTLFVKANPVSITLSKSILDERGTRDNLLPDDLHFSSTELLRLFTKPSWTIGKRRVTLQTTEDRPDLIPREVDTAYWADPENAVDTHDMAEPRDFAPLDDGGYSDYDEPPLPDVADVTDTQIGNDLVSTFRPAVISDLQYARRAKKVDVQELKRVLWQEIEALPGKSTPFSTLVSGLGATSIPKEMLSDVSVPYCFICLLHLANEHNLDLQASDHELLISAQ